MVALPMTIAGTNGDQIELSTLGSGTFVRPGSGRGFGIPPTEVLFNEGAGDGAVHRSTRRGARTLDLPVVIFGSNRQEVEDNQRRLARVLSDRKGPALLSAFYPNGDIYETRVHYISGAETNYGSDGGEEWSRWVLSLKSPSAYWTSRNSISFEVRNSSTGRGLLPKLSSLKLTSSQAMGVRTVENPGDVDAWPVWVVHGPGDGFNIELDDGQAFTFDTALGVDETITIDTENALVTDQLGVNRYGDLGAAPKLFSLPAGSSQVTIEITGATTASSVVGYYKPRREVMYG